ncbi:MULTISPECIES: hypothetical protein [unclassified Pseudomonas]|uniref:hypothetical protein n=1 Tax=unclassified Pseudomonas TaxID=196821 RepID=UPI001302990B|nr:MULTISPECIES: hypothetical protein [unclassified Pseudomonas]
MASPELATKHQLAPGTLPLQHLTAKMEYQCLDLGESQRRRGRRSEDCVEDFAVSSVHRKMLSNKDSTFPRYSFRIFLLLELQYG